MTCYVSGLLLLVLVPLPQMRCLPLSSFWSLCDLLCFRTTAVGFGAHPPDEMSALIIIVISVWPVMFQDNCCWFWCPSPRWDVSPHHHCDLRRPRIASPSHHIRGNWSLHQETQSPQCIPIQVDKLILGYSSLLCDLGNDLYRKSWNICCTDLF